MEKLLEPAMGTVQFQGKEIEPNQTVYIKNKNRTKPPFMNSQVNGLAARFGSSLSQQWARFGFKENKSNQTKPFILKTKTKPKPFMNSQVSKPLQKKKK